MVSDEIRCYLDMVSERKKNLSNKISELENLRSRKYSANYVGYVNSVFSLVFRNLSSYNELIEREGEYSPSPYLVATKKGIKERSRRRGVKTKDLTFDGLLAVFKRKTEISNFIEKKRVGSGKEFLEICSALEKDLNTAFPSRHIDGSGWVELVSKNFKYEPPLIKPFYFQSENKELEILSFTFSNDYSPEVRVMLSTISGTFSRRIHSDNDAYNSSNMDYYYNLELLDFIEKGVDKGLEKVKSDIAIVEAWIQERKGDLIQYSALLVI